MKLKQKNSVIQSHLLVFFSSECSISDSCDPSKFFSSVLWTAHIMFCSLSFSWLCFVLHILLLSSLFTSHFYINLTIFSSLHVSVCERVDMYMTKLCTARAACLRSCRGSRLTVLCLNECLSSAFPLYRRSVWSGTYSVELSFFWFSTWCLSHMLQIKMTK